MATSTQRLLVMTLALQTLLVMTSMMIGSNELYNNYVTTDGQDLQNHTANYITNFENTNPDTNANIFETQYGDQKEGGKGFFQILKNGVGYNNPCENDYTYCTITETKMGGYLVWIIRIINLLIIFELFLLIYAKKNT